MTAIITTEKVFDNNLVMLTRKLGRDDLIIDRLKPSVGKNLEGKDMISAGWRVSLNAKTLQTLIDALKIGNKHGKFFSPNCLNGLAHEWDVRPKAFFACENIVLDDVQDMGESKEARYAELAEELDQAVSHRESKMLGEVIDEMNNKLNVLIDNHKDEIQQYIREVMVDGKHVKNIDALLNTREAQVRALALKNREKLETKIKQLTEQLDEQKELAYTIERNAITRAALDELGEIGKQIAISFSDTEKAH